MSVDKHNMLKVLREFPSMVKDAISFGDDFSIPKELIENIIVVGMGGSGFSGDLLKAYMHDSLLQIHVIKDYTLPKFAKRKSLVFVLSYSGNTEETISAYRSAVRRGCKIVAISSGGKLQELSEMNKTDLIKIPKGIQPRLATPYMFIPILNVLHYSGIIDDQEDLMKKCVLNLQDSGNKIENKAKELAQKFKDKVPIIYASRKLFAIAEKWKTDINENAKTHAFYNMFSEFNHNEICGYFNPVGKFHTLILNDEDDHERIKRRVEVFKKTLKGYDAEITEIAISGDNYLSRLISAVWLGTFTAYYLALEYGVDPTPVEIIEKFKKDL